MGWGASQKAAPPVALQAVKMSLGKKMGGRTEGVLKSKNSQAGACTGSPQGVENLKNTAPVGFEIIHPNPTQKQKNPVSESYPLS